MACFLTCFYFVYALCIMHITARKSFDATKCDEWYKKDIKKYGDNEKARKWSNNVLETCPSKWSNKMPKKWYADGGCKKGNCPFHPGAYNCMRTWKGQQCCYTKNGKRCEYPLCGGTADRSPMASKWQYIPNGIGHYYKDVVPFDYCCNVKAVWKNRKITDKRDNICNSCEKYFKRRPIYGKGKTWKICGQKRISQNGYNFIDTIINTYNPEIQQIETIETILMFVEVLIMLIMCVCICGGIGFGCGYIVAVKFGKENERI
eukprot:365592_1